MWKAKIAFKYLCSPRKEKFISMVTALAIGGIALGVAALIIIISVMTGFDAELKDKIIGSNAHIIIEREGGIKSPDDIFLKIKNVKNVAEAAPFVKGQAMLSFNNNIVGVFIKGVDIKQEAKVTKFDRYILPKHLPLSVSLSEGEIIAGKELANIINAENNSEIMLISAFLNDSKIYKIKGFFESGMYQYDANMIFMNISDAQKLFNLGNKVSGIEVKIFKEFEANKTRMEIQKLLGGDFWVSSWMDLNRNLLSALKVEKRMMFIVLSFIILVACFNVTSTIMMLVMQKTKDIGILRALGASTLDIRNIFLLQGFFIGFTGALAGTLSGFFLAKHLNKIADLIENVILQLTGYRFEFFPSSVYYFDEIPVLIDKVDIFIIAVVTLIIASLAGLYPAYKASRLNPSDAIRYE